MQVIFISNYINHHQKPFCDAMYERLGKDFIFIQTEPMDEERKNMGWEIDPTTIPYVMCIYEDNYKLESLMLEADVVIAGWTSKIPMVIRRMMLKKLTIRISERIYREGQWKMISPRGLKAKYLEHIRFRKKPVYLLCAGAYVPSDFALINAYPNKMFKFGYFPPMRKYNLEELFAHKDESGMIEIVFAGRFIPLKHPEYLIWLARDLIEENKRRREKSEPLLPSFRIHMVGSGEMEQTLRSMTTEYGLLDNVVFYGFQSPDKVRALMEKCHIMVFCSDNLEGWGAVVNEAMNSACAVVASAEAGAIPYLIRQWDNGVAFPVENFDRMKEAVRFLMTHGVEREAMATKAYKTIVDNWNADNAAETLVYMLEGWMQGVSRPPMDGPLSVAPVISPKNMFRKMEREGVRK